MSNKWINYKCTWKEAPKLYDFGTFNQINLIGINNDINYQFLVSLKRSVDDKRKKIIQWNQLKRKKGDYLCEMHNFFQESGIFLFAAIFI